MCSRLSSAESLIPRFFFDISDGELIIDTDGTEFPNAHAARDEAIKVLPDIARTEIAARGHREVLVLMRDEAGRALFTAALTLTAKWLVDDVEPVA